MTSVEMGDNWNKAGAKRTARRMRKVNSRVDGKEVAVDGKLVLPADRHWLVPIGDDRRSRVSSETAGHVSPNGGVKGISVVVIKSEELLELSNLDSDG